MSSITGDPVTLVNRRTATVVSFTADGRRYDLKPGLNYGYNSGHAEFAYKQNPLLGTQDYESLKFTSLVGIIAEDGEVLYPCDPIEDEIVVAAEGGEIFDIATMPDQAKHNRSVQKGRYLGGRGSVSQAGGNALAVG